MGLELGDGPMPESEDAARRRLIAIARREHAKIGKAMARRDEAISAAVAAGARQTEVGDALGITHTAVQHCIRRHKDATT